MDSPSLQRFQQLTLSTSMPQKPTHEKRSILERLPRELLDIVTSHLDPVSLLCLKNTSGHFYASIPKPSLSHCARIEIIFYLNLDRAASSRMDTPTSDISRCSGYSRTRTWDAHTYCSVCRANGHMEYCLECGVRTCVRRSDYRWKKWVGEEKERKERKKREAAEAPAAAQKEKRTNGNAKGEKRRETKASSALEIDMSEGRPFVWLRSGGINVGGKRFEHREERFPRDPSRKGWGTQGLFFEMPVIEELSLDADDEMKAEVDDEMDDEMNDEVDGGEEEQQIVNLEH